MQTCGNRGYKTWKMELIWYTFGGIAKWIK